MKQEIYLSICKNIQFLQLEVRESCVAANVKPAWLKLLLLKASPRSQGRTTLQGCKLSVSSVMTLILIEVAQVGLILVLGFD